MKHFILSLVVVASWMIGSTEAGTLLGSFTPTIPPTSPIVDTGIASFTNFTLGGGVPGRSQDDVSVVFDTSFVSGGKNIRGYTVTYTFSAGITGANNTTLAFDVASTSPWEFKRFRTSGLSSGDTTFAVTGTGSNSAGGSSVGTENGAGSYVSYASGKSSSSYNLDYAWNSTSGGSASAFTVYFELQSPVSTVPEPASMAIFGLGALGVAFKRYRRNR